MKTPKTNLENEPSSRRFRDLSLRLKLFLVFLGLALMIGGAGGSGLLFVKKISNSMEVVVNLATPLTKSADSLIDNVQETKFLAMEVLASADELEILQSLASIEELDRHFQVKMEELGNILSKGQIALDLQSTGASQKQFTEQVFALVAAQRQKLAKEALAGQRLAEFEQRREKLQTLLTKFA